MKKDCTKWIDSHYLTFNNAKNLDEWLGVLVTKVYHYFYIFHDEPVECHKWPLSGWIQNQWYTLKCAYNFSFKHSLNVPFLTRLKWFTWRLPPINFIRHLQYQVRWRLWRKSLGHTWLRWRL